MPSIQNPLIKTTPKSNPVAKNKCHQNPIFFMEEDNVKVEVLRGKKGRRRREIPGKLLRWGVWEAVRDGERAFLPSG